MRIVEVSLEMNCWGFSGNSHLWNRAMESHMVLAGFIDKDQRETRETTSFGIFSNENLFSNKSNNFLEYFKILHFMKV